MREALLVFAVVLGFATWTTAHVAMAVRLALRKPRLKGLAAFFVPPLAPIWGYRAGLKKNTLVWCLGLGVYLAALLTAKLTG